MLRHLPFALAAGLASAVLYAVALNGSLIGILLAYLAMLPLFAIGLSFGAAVAVAAAGSATVAIAVFGGVLPGLVFAVSHALPSAAVTLMALRRQHWSDGKVYWYPPGRLLIGLALWSIGLMVVAGVTLAVLGIGFADGIRQFLAAMAEAFSQPGTQDQDPQPIGGVSAILPGIVAWSWIVMVTVNGLLGQVIARRLDRAIRPSLRIADIEIGRAWIGAFAVCALVGLLAPGDLGFGAANVAIVMAYPLFFQGLSVVHRVLGHWGGGPMMFGVFYVLLVLMSWLVIVLVAVGLAEPFVRLRSRLAGRHTT